MSNKKPLIVICGATGQQGGSVLRAMKKTGKYRFRALTRDPNSTKAQKIKDNDDVELFQIDVVKEMDRIPEAFEGATGVFAVTDFWANPKIMTVMEEPIGKKMVDAAIEKGVKWFIWSTLPDVNVISKGRLTHVAHCDNKARVEQYARQRSKEKGVSTIFSYVIAGNYYQNYDRLKIFKISDADPDVVVNEPLNVKPTTKIFFTDIDEDFGKVVSAMFENIDKVKDKTIKAITTGYTLEDLLRETAKALGKKYKYNEIDDETMEKYMGAEAAEMYQSFKDCEDALNEITDGNDPKKLVGPLKTPKEWVASYGVDYLKK